MRSMILGMAVTIFALNTVIAGPFEDAGSAYGRGDRAATLTVLRAQAGEDATRVQTVLGRLFPPCRDSSGDYSEIVALFRADAERGNARAQFNLGNAYFFGNGVPKDDAKAAEWYRRAAYRGEAGAMQNLGYMYENGKGVPQDYVQAYRWLSLSLSRHAEDGGKDVNAEAAEKSLYNVIANMTPTDVAEALGLVRAWIPVAEHD